MEIKKTGFIGRCPNCHNKYILFDNEIIFCPGCVLSSFDNKSFIYEEDGIGKKVVQEQT